MRYCLLLSVFGMGMISALALRGQTVPSTINYQGRLTDNSPSPAPVNATTNMQFEIWDLASGGSASPNRLCQEPNLPNAAVLVPVSGGALTYAPGTPVAMPPPPLHPHRSSARLPHH